MFARSGKKEIWLGTALDPDLNGNPQLEISWGYEGRRRVAIPFEEFVDDILGGHERGGPNTGGRYDDEAISVLTRMINTLKLAKKHARKRNEDVPY